MGLGYTDITGKYYYGNGDYYEFYGHVTYHWGGGTPWQGWTFKDFVPGLIVNPSTNNDDSFTNSLNSTGNNGYYVISQATNHDSWSSFLFQPLRINRYYDAESGETRNINQQASYDSGRFGLGSESAYIANNLGQNFLFNHSTEGDYLTTYTISPSATSINEGETLTNSISTTNVAANTTLYYSLSGTGISSDDFSSGVLAGSGFVDSNGNFSFSHALANDFLTEGDETCLIKLFTDSDRSQQVASSSFIIKDTSINQSYTLASNSPTITEGDTGTKNLVFTLTLDATPTEDITVNYETLTTGTATVGEDFIADSGTVTFTSGSTTATVVIAIKGDTTYENNGDAETVEVKFSGDDLRAITFATGYITENDPIDKSSWTVHESTGSFSLVEDPDGKFYARDKASNDDHPLYDYGNTRVTRSIFSDVWGVERINGINTIGFGSNGGNIHIWKCGNAWTKSEAGNYSWEDAQILFAGGAIEASYSLVTSGPKNEGDEHVTTVTTTNVAENTPLYWSISGISESDLSAGSLEGICVINASGNVVISHKFANDFLTEGDETCLIKLFTDSDRSQQVASSSFIIKDTSINQSYTLASNSPTITEGDTGTKNLVFTLTLDATPTEDITVNYETLTTGTATVGEDFIADSGTVTFTSGSTTATVVIAIKGDTTYENNGDAETVRVKFSGINLAADVTATGLIIDNDNDDDKSKLIGSPLSGYISNGELYETYEGTGNTNAIDNFTLVDNVGNNSVYATINSTGSKSYYAQAIKDSKIDLGGGIGYINITVNKGYYASGLYSSHVTTGRGDDEIQINLIENQDFTYGAFALEQSTLSTGSGDDFVQINVKSSRNDAFDSKALYVSSINLGADNDLLIIDVDNSSVNTDIMILDGESIVFLGTGDDICIFSTTGYGLKGDKSLNRWGLIYLEEGSDIFTINSNLNSLEYSRIFSGSGDDIIALLNSNDSYYSIVDSEINLEEGDDTLTINSSKNSTVNGGDGKDNIVINDIQSRYLISNSTGESSLITKKTDSFFELKVENIEKITFSDGVILIDNQPTYTITPSATTINEGDILTTSISTTNVAEETTLYYLLSGVGITSTDLSSGALTGSGIVDSNGDFSFSHTLANDLTTEGDETVKIKLFSDSARTTQVYPHKPAYHLSGVHISAQNFRGQNQKKRQACQVSIYPNPRSDSLLTNLF